MLTSLAGSIRIEELMESVAIDDKVLIAKVKRGDERAYRMLVEKYQARAYKIAFEILHSKEDAEDVVQESFVKAYLSIKKFRGDSRFYTWFYRIVYNMALDLRRKHQRRGGDSVEFGEELMNINDSLASHLGGEVSDPQGLTIRKETLERLKKALTELSPEHRAVIVLREWEGFNYDEIAESTGVSKGTVMSRLHYARKRLQELLNAADESEEAHKEHEDLVVGSKSRS